MNDDDRFNLHCSECGRTLNENIQIVWTKVEGWEKKRGQGGTNHIALRKLVNVFMCHPCMDSIQNGRSPQQQTLGGAV